MPLKINLTTEQIKQIKEDVLDTYGDDSLPIGEFIQFLNKKYNENFVEEK